MHRKATRLVDVILCAHVRRKRPLKKFLQKFRKGESGATAIEYGLIAALIAVVLISSLTRLGNNMSTRFNSVGSSVGSR
ncbi:Flp Flp pilus assembly protein, pilin Flp [Caulobacteraceae bacterium]